MTLIKDCKKPLQPECGAMPANSKKINEFKLPRVAILLCTRDGSKFIDQQLKSLINQRLVDLEIFWSDDGSIDDTKKIVLSYQDKLKITPIKLPIDHCASDHFIKLLYEVPIDFDYYAFCDQDDIWLPHKLENSINLLSHHCCDLYGGRTQLIDKNNNYLELSMEFTKQPSFRNALVQSIAGGNTMVWTQKLHKNIIYPQIINVPSHDWWLYLFSTFQGYKMYYDQKPSVLYRQHNQNNVGANLGLKNQIKRILYGFLGRYQKWNDRSINLFR
jgi:glycosyltransferase involved in cell wall biosynthesis